MQLTIKIANLVTRLAHKCANDKMHNQQRIYIYNHAENI